MKLKTLLGLAKKMGWKVSHERYQYWDNQLKFNDTFILLVTISSENTSSILSNEEKFPDFVTKNYVMEAVDSLANNLGVIDYTYSHANLGTKKYYTYCQDWVKHN